MNKNLHIFSASTIFEKLMRISCLHTGPFCLLFFGEPDIDIPEE